MKLKTKGNLLTTLLFACLFASINVIFPEEKMPDQKPGAVPCVSGNLNNGEILAKVVALAVPFVQNSGQFAAEVKYMANLFSGRFFLTGNELVYLLSKPAERKGAQPDKHGRNAKFETSTSGKSLVFREFFVDPKGGKIGFVSKGVEKAETKVSYFRGSDAGKWRVNIASYRSVCLGQVYPGVEVKLKASGRNVEKVFYVSPRGNLAQIRIGVAGVDGLKIGEDGRLLFKNRMIELAMRKPIAWQEIAGQRHDVKVGYRLLGKNIYGFAVSGDYTKDSTLIIDPDLDTLMASTFLGGGGDDFGYALAISGFGDVYVTGNTASTDFPTTSGAYDQDRYSSDVFVSKLDGRLTTLLASTFLGGSSSAAGHSLALDSAGNVFVTGYAGSPGFPVTSGAYDQTFNGGSSDIFVSKLGSNLTTLMASTYLGGNNYEGSTALAIDIEGNVCLTGWTESGNFPTTSGAFNRKNNDIFVSKFNNSLSTLLASTYLGGCFHDFCTSLALDNHGNVYLTGLTQSDDFPTTQGAYDPTFNGNYFPDNVFIAKLNSSLTSLLASTFMESTSEGHSLALDSSGNVYVTGVTWSTNFPTTPGAYDRSYHYRDIFISKLDGNLSSLLASTFVSSEYSGSSNSIVLDSSGNVYLTGCCFVSKLDSNLTTMLAWNNLGGNCSACGDSLALDSFGNAYVTGSTDQTDFPTTAGAYETSHNGNYDAFIAKLNGSLSLKMDLLVERREVKAFSIVRQYGQIHFLVAATDVPAAQYRIMRRQGGDDFVLLRTVAPSELQDNQFQMQDKYLEKDTPYTYRVEAYDAAGQLLGGDERTI